MSAPPDDFLAFLEARRRDYLVALPARVAALETLWTEACDAGGESLAELERAAHSIAGSAGTFGAIEVGEAGRRLEAAVQGLALAGPAAREASLAAARSALDEMHRTLAAQS